MEQLYYQESGLYSPCRSGKLKIIGAQIVGFDGVDKRMDILATAIVEIPREKPVYVHCHSGLRSYIACRILSGNGYECYNLAGGWWLYESVINETTVPEYICIECK